jgi:tetratricopeptide (TPR) repeat protein
MKREFVFWCLLLLLSVSLFVFGVAAPYSFLASNRHAPWFHAIELLLAMLIFVLVLGAVYRWPPRRSHELPVAGIEPFRCVRLRGKFNGEALAARLLGLIDQESTPGASRYSPADAPSEVQFKLGEGGLSIPVAVLKQVWTSFRAREVIKVRGIVEDQSNPISILLQFNRSCRRDEQRRPTAETTTVRVELSDEPLGLDEALFQASRDLLTHLDPIRLARRYWGESNYLPAIRLFKAQIAKAGVGAEIELELAKVELECHRSDSALAHLLHVKKNAVPENLRQDLNTLMARAYFSRGEYDKCEEVTQEALKQSHTVDQAAALYSQLATVSACKEDYDLALRQWDEAKKACLGELGRRLDSPGLDDWSQLVDEVGVASERSNLFPLVSDLYHIFRNEALCLWRLGNDPTASFRNADRALVALNLVDPLQARPRQLGARLHRAYAAHRQSRNDSEEADQVLKAALTWEDEAIQKYKSEMRYRLGDVGILIRLAWSYFGRFDCLHRILQTARESDKPQLEQERKNTLSECKNKLNEIAQAADKHYQAEVAYANACLWSIQSNVIEGVTSLRTAIETTRSPQTRFSNMTNRAKLDEDFDNIRSESSFRGLVYDSDLMTQTTGADR